MPTPFNSDSPELSFSHPDTIYPVEKFDPTQMDDGFLLLFSSLEAERSKQNMMKIHLQILLS